MLSTYICPNFKPNYLNSGEGGLNIVLGKHPAEMLSTAIYSSRHSYYIKKMHLGIGNSIPS